MSNDRGVRPRSRLHRLLLAGALLVALALAACTDGAQDALLLDSVPADAVMLGSVQPQRALGDSSVRDTLDQLLGLFGDRTLEDALAQVQEASGIDLVAVEQVLVFQAAEQRGAVLVAGPYDQEKIRTTAEEKAGGLSVSVHRGHDLYTAEEGKTLAFLEDDLLLVGALESAKAVIDVREGAADALGGDLRDSFVALGDPPAKLFALTPDGLLDKTQHDEDGDSVLDDLPVDLDFLTGMRSLGGTLEAVQQDFALTLTMTYTDAEKANGARQTIEAVLGLVTLFAGAPELTDLLDTLEVTAAAEVLTVTGQFSPDDLQGVAEALKAMDAAE